MAMDDAFDDLRNDTSGRYAADRAYTASRLGNTGAALRNAPPTDYSEFASRAAANAPAAAVPGRSIATIADAAAPEASLTQAANGTTGAPLRIADTASQSIGRAVPVYEPPPGLPAPSQGGAISRLASTAANDAVDVAPRAVGNGAAAAAGPLESAAMTTLRRVAPAIGAIPDAVSTARVAADPNSTPGDVVRQGAEGVGKVGAAIAGANVGQQIGGVAGPIGRIAGGIIGGGLGYMGADRAIQSAFGPSPINRLAQQATQPQQPQSSVVPGANGSTVQINPDGTSQLATRPTVGPNGEQLGAGAGRGSVNPPAVQPAATTAAASPVAATKSAAATQAAPAQPAANPFDGAVQIIRPGGVISYAVQGPNQMVELDPATYGAYHQALTKNPEMAQRLQMTDAGPMIDGVSVPANLVAAGAKGVDEYIASLNRAQSTGLTPAQQLTLREQNLSHMLPANAPLNTDAGIGGGAPGGAPGLTGDAFLKTLPTPLQAQVKALASGRQPFPTGAIMKTPYGQNLLNAVSQYDPSFDAVNYGARAKTRNDFTAGKSAQSINAMNTVAGHLESLSDAADRLNNTSVPLANGVKNWLENSTGDPRVKQFEATKKAVVDELTRVWRGNGGSEGDIKSWAASLDAANSPQQLHGVIGQIGELIGSKINALGEQYKQGMGTTGEPIQLVTPKTQAVFAKLQQRAGGEPASAAPQLVRKTASDGKTYEYDGKGWYEVQ